MGYPVLKVNEMTCEPEITPDHFLWSITSHLRSPDQAHFAFIVTCSH
jgi:hypothetical protein